MALGKTHDRFNFMMALVFLASLIKLQLDLLYCSFFILGWIYSTFYFSPDSDLLPKKRLGLLRWFFYPYTMFSKHRGRSHSIFWGTLLRALYSFVLIYLLTWLLFGQGIVKYDPKDFFSFFSNFNISKLEYKLIVWFYLGMFFADLCHIFLDKVSGIIPWR